MITPGFLQKDDTIAVVAPAGKIDPKLAEKAIRIIETWGLKVLPGNHLFGKNYSYSGTDDQRLNDLQYALDDPNIKAILCVRGGYGLVRIIDQIDFGGFLAHPKWIIGFSDITVLHAHIQKHCSVKSIHGSMAKGVVEGGSALTSLKSMLFGQLPTYKYKSHALSKPGKATGFLTGGNLAMLHAMLGSSTDQDLRGKILFLEETGEHLYRLDRMLWSLNRANKLKLLNGLVVGGMTDIPDSKRSFGKNAYEIIHEHVSGYDYPVCYNFPAGHQKDNRALMLGSKVSLNIGKESSLTFYPG
jgi:muramoyltetrapeptide carboxypeptidase